MAADIYRSTDVGAPVLNGTVGSLITLLDACLVNGYGSKTAAGWTKAYSGTNLAAYRMSTAGSSSGCYLRVDDTGTREGRIIGYKTMSDVNTGTNQFPTTLQQSGGYFVKKSTTIDGTARPWVLLADERFFYLFINANVTNPINSDAQDGFMYFGDLISNKPVDGNECVICGAEVTLTTSGTTVVTSLSHNSYSSTYPCCVARDYTGITASVKVCPISRIPYAITSPTIIGASLNNAYPDPVTGGISLFELEILENSLYGARGVLPGWYFPYGGRLIGQNWDTFAGTGNMSGKNFILVNLYNGSSAGSFGRGAFQYDGSWR